MITESAYLSATTVNVAEYTIILWNASRSRQLIASLIIVGDSNLLIQQNMGAIACKKDSLQAMLAHHHEVVAQFNLVRYLHIIRCYNAAADTPAFGALETK